MERSLHENDQQVRVNTLEVLVGITVVAVWCAENRPSFDYPDLSQQLISILSILVHLLIVFSGSAGLFLFTRRWVLRRETSFQPGHWWLCIVGISVLYLLVVELIKWNLKVRNELDREWDLKFLIGLQAGQIGVYWLSGLLLPVRKVWWLTLVPPTLINLAGVSLWGAVIAGYAQHGVYYHDRFQPLLLLLDLVVILAIAIWDAATTSIKRDWIHWWGVGTAMMLSGSELAIRAVYWFGWVT